MFYSDDPVRDFENYDRAQAERLARLPKCSVCDEPIQDDHYYLINGENVCPACLENEFRKEVDDS